MENFTRLKLEYIKEYVLTTMSVYDIFDHIAPICVRFLESVSQTILALVALLIYLVILIIKIVVLIFPHACSFGNLIIDFHRTKLTSLEICCEITLLAAACILWLYRKRIKTCWKNFQTALEKRSKVAATLAPHVIFFGFASVIAYTGQKFLNPLASPKVLPIFSLLFPVLWTVDTMRRTYEHNPRLLPEYKKKISLWIILSEYHAIATLLYSIPFSSRLQNIVPYVREFLLTLLVWAQFYPKFVDFMLKFSSPLLDYVASKLPASNLANERNSYLLKMLRTIGYLSVEWENYIVSFLQDGVIILIAAFSLFLPSFLAFIGVVAIVFFFPAFRSLAVCKRNETKPIKKWLHYWICIAIVWLVHLYMVKCWPSVLMVMSIWLQHEYFDGATKCFNFITEALTAIAARENKVRTVQASTESNQQIQLGVGEKEHKSREETKDTVADNFSTDEISNSIPQANDLSTDERINNIDDNAQPVAMLMKRKSTSKK